MTDKTLSYYRKIVLFFFLFSIQKLSVAQFYTTGQLPPGINWKQINTENFQIIYPEEFQMQAMRTANLLENLHEYTVDNDAVNTHKIPVLLNNRSLYSNGFVAWAPKRIEMVTTPPQDNYPQLWMDQLAIHEYRHDIQLSNLDHGVTKLLNVMFGQMATGAVAGYIPFWYLEGDAVAYETSLTSTGRGRLPSFSMKLKADLVNDIRYTYDKAYLGSYKNFIPNYYELGYQMVKYNDIHNHQAGNKKLESFVGRNPYMVTPFNRGLKKYTGLSKSLLYKQTLDSLQYNWKTEYKQKSFTSHTTIYTDYHKYYTSYRFPVSIGEDSVLALRSSLDDIDRFVLLTDRKEEVIFTPGRIPDVPFSYKNGKLLWVEYIPDIRWQKSSYSRMKLYNLKTKKLHVIRKGKRCLAAVFSPDGKRIAAISAGYDNQYSIIILQTESENKEQIISLPENTEFSDISWSSDDQLYGILTTDEGKQIISIDILSGNVNYIFNSKFINISYPVFYKNDIYFNYAYDGTDNIYVYNLNKKQVYRVTSVPFGAFDPSIDYQNELLYTVYYSDGYKPVKILTDKKNFVPVSQIEQALFKDESKHSRNEDINMQTHELSDSIYPVKSYSDVTGLFNIHSWTPFYVDTDINDLSEFPVYPGLTLFNQNKLGTFYGNFSYYYKEGYHHFKPVFTYAGLFPVFSFSADYGGIPEFTSMPEGEELPEHLYHYRTYSISASVPLSLQMSRFYQYILIDIEYDFQNSYYFSNGYKLGINNLKYLVYFSNWLKMSARDINPRWRQSFLIRYNNYLDNDFSSQISISAGFSFPGFARHHVLTLSGSYEKQSLSNYQLTNYISMPRGYTNTSLSYYIFGQIHPFTIEKIQKLRIDYTLPLLDPDFSIGPLVYIKRIYMSPFYDLANASILFVDDNNLYRLKHHFSSLGFELYSEIHFLRFVLASFTPGLRTSYTLENHNLSFDFLFDFSF